MKNTEHSTNTKTGSKNSREQTGQATEAGKFVLALAGNPNCGKTTIFNALTGSKQRVGNWPGVTVEKKEGLLELPEGPVNVVDLPGIYGLSASSEDERVSRDFLMSGEADAILNIIDASNLERNLYLSIQLLETGIPVIMAVNMLDIAMKRGFVLDEKLLSDTLGIPVVPMNALEKKDMQKLKTVLAARRVQVSTHHTFTYSETMEKFIQHWTRVLADAGVQEKLPGHCDPRWLVIRLLEKDEGLADILASNLGKELIDGFRTALAEAEQAWGEESDILVADQKYGHIEALIHQTLKKPGQVKTFSEKLDKVFLNRIAGIPLFLGAMYLVFWTTISFGGAFIDFFDRFFGAIFVDGFAALLQSWQSPAWLVNLLAGGIGAGIQTVSTFVPIIFTMFFMLSILEDSGYMARAAFVMDRLMRKVGLPGKAFVPMLLGLGCTIPAIMATRTLDTRQDRFTTIFMAPLMSCGARLPVYALFGAALFGNLAGVSVFALYLTGILVSILTGLLVKRTVFRGEVSHFVMELPPYHLPNPGKIFLAAGRRLGTFVRRAGTVITLVVVILSGLNSIGIGDKGITFGNQDTDASLLAGIGKAITPVFNPLGISNENWPATVGLFTGLFAKEAVVGTVNSLYSSMARSREASSALPNPGVGDQADTELGDAALSAADATQAPASAGDTAPPVPDPALAPPYDLGAGILGALETIPANLSGLGQAFVDPLGLGVVSGDEAATAEELEAEPATFTLMRQFFNPQAGFAYLLFILIYFPCVAALGTAIQELGGRLGAFQATYLTVLAWAVATLWYQLSFAHEIGWILVALGLIAGIIAFFNFAGPRLVLSAVRKAGKSKEALNEPDCC